MIKIDNYDSVNHTNIAIITMQWNCTSPFLPNTGYDPFNVSKVPSYPQIIGEGDVTSVIFPDGTFQLYFVPTNRHVTLSPFQFNTNFSNLHCTANKDIWFVRSISHPLPPSLLNRPFPNVYGDQQPPPQFNPNFCINSPPSPDYYQKFHNDVSTSTTDIHYFFPNLRYNRCLKYSAEIQTDPVAIDNTYAVGGCPGHCCCKSADRVVKKNTDGNASASSSSYMSVDSASKSQHRLTKKNKKKSKHKSNKSRDHSCACDVETQKSKYENKDLLCECNAKKKQISDKLVATYAEKASGATVKDGRHTQTVKNKSNRSDITTELWVPIDCKSSSTLKLDTCGNSSGQCCCKSTSETDCE